ncbi:CAP domain-containing protein [Mucilaginibacter sp.]|uniref:CAP domain-containing protein n=1 Tax=Mucilaginibacter sp. TaxID=1882438 RepID=UPI0025DDD3D1|nr:CAP domain-containing protein [Mucilaginibacter sp.]
MRNLIAKVICILTISLSFGTAYGQSEPFKSEFLARINAARSKGCNCGNTYFPPAPPLTWNNKLFDAATGHAKDMARSSYFSHTSKDGRSMEDRVVSAGYKFKGFKSFAIGENIAQGQQSIAEVMDGWLKSEGHCKNLMNRDFKEVGIAEYKTYWVQDFGGRTSFTAEQQKLIKSGRYKLIQN